MQSLTGDLLPPGRPSALARCALPAVFALAFVLRAAPIVYLEVREPGWHANHIEELEFYYDDVGRSLMLGKGFVHSVNPRPNCAWGFQPGTPFDFEPPLYACWIGAVYWLFGPNIFLGKILQCAMDSSVCLLLYMLARRVSGGRMTALCSALLYAIYPLAIVIGLHYYYQIPLNLIVIWLVLCLMAPATWKNGIWTGLAVGLSALAQPVTLPLLAILPIVRFGECLRRTLAARSWLLWCLVFSAAGLGALAPWTMRNYELFHRLVPIRNGAEGTMLQGSTDAYLDLTTDAAQKTMREAVSAPGDCLRAAVENHLQHVKAAPLDYFRFLGRKFLMAWYNTEGKAKNRLALEIQLPFLALAVLGLVCARAFG